MGHERMKLAMAQKYALLAKHGCFVIEACDKCGRLLGPVRFARQGKSGVWCSRQCRDGKDAHAPGTCQGCGASLNGMKRGTKWCSDTCRKRPGFQKVLNMPENPGIAAHSKGVKE